ncbi:uncharacterized protein LOC144485241 [Mustelus asterias]
MAEGFNSGVYPISSKRLTLDNDPNSKITEFLTNCEDDQLLLLTKFYRDRLEQAIEGVARLCLMFAACDHIGVKESHKVKEIADSGNLADCSKLLLNLVIEKGPRALRVMWESFVEMHRGLPKLEKILRELPTLGPDAFVHMNIPQGLSEVPSNLKDLQQKHKETLRVQTETLRVNTILIKEKVKIFQLKKIVFRDGDLTKYKLEPSQFLSGFLVELLERDDSAQSVVYTFPHLTIQEFAAALSQFLTPDPGEIGKLLSEAHSEEDGRFEIFLRFVAGLSSPQSARPLEEFLGPFLHQTTCRVIDWVKEKVEGQIGDSQTGTGKRKLLNTFHYLFESQNKALVRNTVGSVEKLSFRGLRLTPIDCAVLSHVIGLCDTIKHLDLQQCYIQCEGLQRLGPVLHKCQDLSLHLNNVGDSGVLGDNKLGDSGVKLLSVALRNPECKIQKLRLQGNDLTDSCAEDLASALSTNRSLIDLNLGSNKLGDSGVKLLSVALRNPDCKIQKLHLVKNALTDSCAEDLASALSTNQSLRFLSLGSNSFTDQSVPALRRLILTCRSLEPLASEIEESYKLEQKRFRFAWDGTEFVINWVDLSESDLTNGVYRKICRRPVFCSPLEMVPYLRCRAQFHQRLWEECPSGCWDRHLFHGTSAESASSIGCHNFDPGLSGRNGCLYGRGSYFATRARYSHEFALPVRPRRLSPRRVPLLHMFLAKVLTGRSALGSRNAPGPPSLAPAQPAGGRFDSCVNSLDRPTIYVLFDSAQCYPYWLIQYQAVDSIVIE